MGYSFNVDLRGIVDLLSHHLYASPRVYVRELLQNAVDAITARRVADPGAPGQVLVESPAVTGDGTLRVHDTGIGLTEQQVHDLLATIGRSSKRDDLGFARHEFLGQFGIGLLSCFLVADEIRVSTRCGDAPTVEWTGYADGRYEVAIAPVDRARPVPGTTVTLVPRRDAEHWLRGETVAELARLFGSMLPIAVRVDGQPVTTGLAPWHRDAGESATARRARLDRYAEEVFGFPPFDVIDLDVPAAGLRGVAFVLPVAANPASRVAHRVYLKQMLLSESIEGLLPEWAFFVRCVVDTTELRPTASREALYEDDVLDEVRESLGAALRGWLTALGRTDPRRLATFLSVHHLGVKALALHDDEMLRLLYQWWRFETNVGPMTLADFHDRYGVVRFIPSVDEFRQLAPVAAAQSIALVNAGYVYDAELLRRLPDIDATIDTEVLTAGALAMQLEPLDPAGEQAVAPFLRVARRALEPLGVEVLVRAFEPASLPALYLLDSDTALHVDLRRGRDEADDTWAAILGSFTAGRQDLPQLVFNHRNPLVRQTCSVGDEELVTLAVEGLYVQALLLGHQPLRPADTAALNQSFLGLLGRAMGEAR
ncbi:molecular chaperone HtpG [Asanoa ferruginea]|uniref:Molecular chaperone HtpG n=1 Tax=Asanoa ferruginea TaxID=53367 RepID=A0A3D9ZRA1_9ACTN|nr:HSP90 family protein [Asanoa ferruginea]REF98513.1 molecular chaperone HtpG [Asanoa ferruginea]GIF53390.1 molecular chaperone HtpG [Asanoa ferruginea]